MARDRTEPLLFSSEASDSGEDGAGFFSRYTFWWIFPSIRAANGRGKLFLTDIPALPRADNPGLLHQKFEATWRGGGASSLLAALIRIQPGVIKE